MRTAVAATWRHAVRCGPRLLEPSMWARASRHRPDVDPPVVGEADYGSCVDAKTEEVRAAHDVLAEFYADRLADALDHMPAERTVLGLFCDLTLAAGLGTSVGAF